MAYPAFNLDKLPYPVRDNFGAQYGRDFTQSQMDSGRWRNRRRFASLPFQYSLTWFVTWDQLAYFEAFLKYDVASANGFFTMPLNAVTDSLTLRFTAYPKVEFDSSRHCWSVQGTVEEIRPNSNVTEITTLQEWPDSLPVPEQASYAIERPDTVTRSTETDGIARSRLRFEGEWANVTMTWNFTPEQYATFDSFVHNQLFGGLAPFKGYFSNGEGLTMVRVQFIKVPTIEDNGANFTVTGTLQLTDIPVMSEIDYRGSSDQVFADSITFTDSVTFNIKRSAFSDEVDFADAIKFAISTPIFEDITFAESVSLVHQGNQSTVDTFGFSDTVAFYIEKEPFAESVTFTASGGILTDEYATGWCVFAYNAAQTAFVN